MRKSSILVYFKILIVIAIVCHYLNLQKMFLILSDLHLMFVCPSALSICYQFHPLKEQLGSDKIGKSSNEIFIAGKLQMQL